MKRMSRCLIALLAAAMMPCGAWAFCGFYVAKADARLFNRASQVALVRDADRTVITMANDFEGETRDFAIVVPVPVLLQRDQIHVTERGVLQHLDAYSAPRLVEYFDEDPCRIMYRMEQAPMAADALGDAKASRSAERARSLGVTIEAEYTVGEYDILILSARQSEGLITWLNENRYRIPAGAEAVVNSYLKQGMRFFVAKVNLHEQARLGYGYLRPLQIAFESPRFMLPIRLGTVNADGPQELYVYLMTRKGRVETTNYRTVKMPSGMELPEFVKTDFGNFYQDMFTRQHHKENRRAVFVEYAWDMAWCDPCAADPLSQEELRELGVFWLPQSSRGAQAVFLTRLHLRYDREHFPQDLRFRETGDRGNFQGRYIIRHPWRGESRCPMAELYLTRTLPERQRREAQTLASLTGWEMAAISARMPDTFTLPEDVPWWKRLWRN